MRRAIILSAALAPFLLGLAAAANEKPSADLQAAMKANQASQTALRGHIKAMDYDGIAKDADTIKANYMKTDPFWATKKWDDAIALNKKGMTAASDLATAAKAKNDDQITMATQAVNQTCGACHMAHREQLPDKTFEIK